MSTTQNQLENFEALLARENERVDRLQKTLWLAILVATLALAALAYFLISRLPTDEGGDATRAFESRMNNLVTTEAEQREEQIAHLQSEMEKLTLAQGKLADAQGQTQTRDELRAELAKSAGENKEDLEASLKQYEARLDDLMTQANDPTIENEIAETKSQISNIRNQLETFSTRLDCATLASRSTVRTLTLQSRDSTALPEEDIVISLGRYRNNVLDAVSINARALPGEPVSTRVIGQVPIGSSIEFSHDEENYTATFTYANTRFLSSALIGLELRRVPEALADCP